VIAAQAHPVNSLLLPVLLYQLYYSEWTEGSLASEDSEQWFSFKATATTQYIHFKEGTSDDVYIQLHDSTGEEVGYRRNLYGSSDSTEYISLTSGDTYYIKATPYSGSTTGNFHLAFSASIKTPDEISEMAEATSLTLDTWKSGAIATETPKQWFGIVNISSVPKHPKFHLSSSFFSCCSFPVN